jgi:hypothetical protein
MDIELDVVIDPRELIESSDTTRSYIRRTITRTTSKPGKENKLKVAEVSLLILIVSPTVRIRVRGRLKMWKEGKLNMKLNRSEVAVVIVNLRSTMKSEEDLEAADLILTICLIETSP